ncbi:hypothetical protein BDV27DRAFT_121173 [Aspergillus caelatus]|uniref:Chitin-binding type-2 domain-containing protein n=1 Tax=Aspergillus caelatus TaxID=61420 RepID=A0A5N7AH14_9EURO|nr:uncharacterized protein BDV27DRAFT_121173 [Aspergillus caelatus]KAE8369167.1 hypothetical protein BDV27DRAFT_121173 [Aspergillus caelatus]
MQFTSFKALAIFAASLFAFSATARPSCETGATWPDHGDCHSFFECSAGGIAVRKTCGPGTAYSSKFGICDYEEKVGSCHGHGSGSHDESQEGHGEQVKGHGNDQSSGGHGQEGKKNDNGQGSEGHGQEGKNNGKGQWSEGHGQEGKNNGNGQQEHGEGSH